MCFSGLHKSEAFDELFVTPSTIPRDTGFEMLLHKVLEWKGMKSWRDPIIYPSPKSIP